MISKQPRAQAFMTPLTALNKAKKTPQGSATHGRSRPFFRLQSPTATATATATYLPTDIQLYTLPATATNDTYIV